ncbi:hypothetical protein [Egicoccus halophilus]|uniref:Secreted protein n=1 Tax=Egicoccus halophilus TaxID=1670830 RepID=A0A8J3AEW9_9ACTN|nr:hypothetical protein [Egicoccus halophilus]GGI06095.1 hypothetical protein GCM10011354_17390 [Egicoccus halophilus]
MRKILASTVAAAAALTFSATAASAAVELDPATGAGFVGKGDVQTVLGWNNKQLQDRADALVFTFESVAEVSWSCTKTHEAGNSGKEVVTVQERSRVTTTSGVVSHTERVRNQITGFWLTGFAGEATTVDGPAIGTCPAEQSGFVFDDNLETVVVGGGLQVNGVALS